MRSEVIYLIRLLPLVPYGLSGSFCLKQSSVGNSWQSIRNSRTGSLPDALLISWVATVGIARLLYFVLAGTSPIQLQIFPFLYLNVLIPHCTAAKCNLQPDVYQNSFQSFTFILRTLKSKYVCFVYGKIS